MGKSKNKRAAKAQPLKTLCVHCRKLVDWRHLDKCSSRNVQGIADGPIPHAYYAGTAQQRLSHAHSINTPLVSAPATTPTHPTSLNNTSSELNENVDEESSGFPPADDDADDYSGHGKDVLLHTDDLSLPPPSRKDANTVPAEVEVDFSSDEDDGTTSNEFDEIDSFCPATEIADINWHPEPADLDNDLDFSNSACSLSRLILG